MTRFMQFVNKKYNLAIKDYSSLYLWSVKEIPEFWGTMWEFGDVQASEPYQQVVKDLDKLPGAKWFEGARLNFAQNLLRFRDDQTAMIFK